MQTLIFSHLIILLFTGNSNGMNACYEKINNQLLIRVQFRVFDPIRFISPVTVKIKLLCQSVCQQRVQWDQKVPFHIHQRWLNLLKELEALQGLSVPSNCLLNSLNPGEIQIHLFCDASIVVYGPAAEYTRSKTSNPGDIKVQKLTSRSRVAPKNNKSDIHTSSRIISGPSSRAIIS